ncbi:MAG: ABC transporter permease subunit, partial [Chloroflexota bacterium]
MAKTSRVQVLAKGARSRVAAWLEATEQGYLQYPFSLVRAVVGLPKLVWLVVVVLIVGSVVSFGTGADVPKGFSIGPTVSRAVDNGVDWMVVNWDPFFSAINRNVLQHFLLPLENWLLGLPWWLVIGVVAFVSYRMVGLVFGLLSVGMMIALAAFGLFDLAMTTLAIVLVSTVLAVILGVPTGIAMAKSTFIDGVIRPTLDLMQTMPSFVYLIPVLMLFGLGKVPAVIAVVIYAVAPIVRLTSLGIRQVDGSVIEASRAFGATGTQVLLKVQLPLALPAIMAGLNQTIMMALSMVVIASMIGAKGLGVEVLNGIARLEVGRGLLGGIGIVIMAV